MTKQDIVDQMLRTTYKEGGRGPDAYDCWGLVLEVCRSASWPVPRDPLEFATSLASAREIFGRQVVEDEWRPCGIEDGAVAFFGASLGAARHAGIVIGGKILHTRRPVPGMTRGGPIWQSRSDVQAQKLEFAQWVG